MRRELSLIFGMLLVSSVFSQSFTAWGFEMRDRVGGAHSGPLLDGNEAYVTVGPELRVYDISDPTNLTQIGSLDLGQPAAPEFIIGETLVMNGSHLLIDIRDPVHPAVLINRERGYHSGWFTSPVFPDERTGIEAGFGRVLIWDVSSIFAPVVRGSLSDADGFGAASVIAPEVFAVAWSGPVNGGVIPMVQQIGISTHSVVERGVEHWDTGTLGEVAVQMDQICPEAGPDAYIDLLSPHGTLTWLDPLAVISAYIRFHNVNGEEVSCEDGPYLLAFDLSDSASPEFVAAHFVAPQGEVVFNQGHRLHIRGGDFGEEGHLVYDLSPDGMALTQVLSEPWPPERIDTAVEDPGRSILATGSHRPISAYTLTPDGGFVLLDSAPREVGRHAFVHLIGDRLVTVDWDGGIEGIEVSPSGALNSAGSLRLEANIFATAREGDRLLLLHSGGHSSVDFLPIPSGLYLVDVSDPANLTLLVRKDIPGTWTDVLVEGNRVFFTTDYAVSREAAGFLLQINAGDQIEPIGPIDLPATGSGPAAVAGDLFAVGVWDAGFDVVELQSIATPQSPELLTQVATAEHVVDVWLESSELSVLSRDFHNGSGAIRVETYDLADPAHPSLRGIVELLAEDRDDYVRLLQSGDKMAVVGDVVALISLEGASPTLVFEGLPLAADGLRASQSADFESGLLALSATFTGTYLFDLASGEVFADTVLNGLLGHEPPEAWMDLSHDGRIDAADQVQVVDQMP